MILRILFLLLSFMVLINLIIVTLCYITSTNLYQKYGKQMLIAAGIFVFIVAAFYVAIALIGLK